MRELSSAVDDVTADLLRSLAASTDLPKLVVRVRRRPLSVIQIPSAALIRWELEDPRGWAAVDKWLRAQGVRIVIV
jgi:hypothetical protein